jgi:hypothetical protein
VVFNALDCRVLLGMTFDMAIRTAQLAWVGFGMAS